MKIQVAERQIIGTRKRQEDAVRIARYDEDDGLLCIVCDGMGGHKGGDVASDTAARRFHIDFASSRGAVKHRLKRALEAANDAIAEKAASRADLSGMGSTLVATYFAKDQLFWISVGDSHLYSVRGSSVSKLNADHSMAPVLDEMAAQGRITQDEANSDPQRNALRSALTGVPIELVDVGQAKIESGTYILASDGLDTLQTDEIAHLVEENSSASANADRLVGAVEAKKKDKQDNTSLIVTRTVNAKPRKKIFGIF